ncbi:exoribonuclease II [Candidatus Erwinia haradaeae]|uniref:Exoribonuclease 2 n=1 Tax=Candidatus Erwinia haradaeae TaxID=1922217 RepID=A0A451DAF5_9GAMM|nr:exoribonuclease II [Candidatus Erwinia haradaeae]VFP83255.1 Exoribonuclease 2 [Candidatus Erwinia haradaeae]
MLQNNPALVLLKNKLRSKSEYVEGIVKQNEKGFGFLEVSTQQSYFIPPPCMKKVMHGDRVAAVVQHHIQNNKELQVAHPEKIIQPFLTRFVGRIQKKNKKLFIIPDQKQLTQAIQCEISKNIMKSALQEGDWVVAELRHHPLSGNHFFYAEITEFITTHANNLFPWWVTLARHNLARTEPTLDSPQEMLDEQLKRQDLTEMPFITIDSANTEDIDDALYIEETGIDQLTLIVAIADPTAYVSVNSMIDTAASERSFTNYLPGFHVSMLPRQLSNNICSLRPHKKRPVLACRITISSNGTPDANVQFFAAWITSRCQLVYDHVSDWLDDHQKSHWQPPDTIIAKQLTLLNRLRIIRNQWRHKNALIFKERPEFRFLLSKTGEVLDIVAEHRRIANYIVEEAMILANICAAHLLRDKFGFGIYNVHFGFDQAHAAQAVTVLSNHGINTDKRTITTLEGFRILRRQLDSLPTQFLSNRIRRFQLLSEIKTTPGPHFGLGLEVYATWTSPIRKYGDMVNHRLLKAIIKGECGVCPTETLALKMSERRKQNRIAEREVSEWLYLRFFQKIVGSLKKFSAEVIDVSRGGLRIRLQENGAVAFIPSSFIHHTRKELVCSHDNGIVKIKNIVIYRVTDMIEVTIETVRMDTRSIIARPVPSDHSS